MKIGLNATCLNNRASGAKQRFVGINKALFRLLADDEFIVYEPADCAIASWFDALPNVRFVRTPLLSWSRLQKFARGLLYWRPVFERQPFDVFEAFHLPLVRAPTGRTLLTIHDVRFMRDRGWSRTAYRPILDQSLKSADRVITVSHSMRDEILGLFPGLPISVIYNGIDAAQFAGLGEDELAAAQSELGLPGEFLLSVGHFEARKNYPGLLSALAVLHSRGRLLPLVIVGNDSGELSRVRSQIANLALQRHVTILSGLTDHQVRCLFKLCSLFVFPSLYEGFGIPVLEAMAANRPMVLSDIPVFREITENQGIYFSPQEPESIAEKIDAVISSSSEQQRLAVYGQGRLRDFKFGSLAAQVARLYREIA